MEISQRLISVFLCVVSLSETRVVLSSGTSPLQQRHPKHNKDPVNNTTPVASLNDVTKWSNEAPQSYVDGKGSNPDDAFLQQQKQGQNEDYYGQDYGRMDLDEKMSQVLLILADLSGEIHGLRNQVGNLKFQNHMVYKQLKRLQSRCVDKVSENDVIESGKTWCYVQNNPSPRQKKQVRLKSSSELRLEQKLKTNNRF